MQIDYPSKQELTAILDLIPHAKGRIITQVVKNCSGRIEGFMRFEAKRNYFNAINFFSNNDEATKLLVQRLINADKWNLRKRDKVFIRINEQQPNAYKTLDVIKKFGFSTRLEDDVIIAEFPPIERNRKFSSFNNF